MKNLTAFRDAVNNALFGAVEVELDDLDVDTRTAVERILKLQAAGNALLIAYANGEARGGSTDWEDLNFAFECAKDAQPGAYESILATIEALNEDIEALAGEPVGDTYRIVRRYRIGEGLDVIREGLSLQQAQEHCEDPGTHGEGWFDSYEKE